MKELLKQQVVITATLLGLSDEQIRAGLTDCEEALKRFKLLKPRGNPNIKTLREDSTQRVMSNEESIIEIARTLNLAMSMSVKGLHPIFVAKGLELSKWHFARQLESMSRDERWQKIVIKNTERGLNVYQFNIPEQKTTTDPAIVEERQVFQKAKIEDNEVVDSIDRTELDDAKLKKQQAEFYLKDIDEKGSGSPYYKGLDGIIKTKTEAEATIKKWEAK